MDKTGLVRILALTLLVALGASCAHLKFWDRDAPQPAAASAADASAPVETLGVSESERDARLRQAIQRHIDRNSGDEQRLVRRRPYFYREYSVYPGGAASADVTIAETDSRLTPYQATVRLEKQRFATRLHRNRDGARNDADFLRDTGEEVVNFEWRGASWEKVGSLFVADRTEEWVNEQWVAVRPREGTLAADEEERGWLSRTWSTLTGGD